MMPTINKAKQLTRLFSSFRDALLCVDLLLTQVPENRLEYWRDVRNYIEDDLNILRAENKRMLSGSTFNKNKQAE